MNKIKRRFSKKYNALQGDSRSLVKKYPHFAPFVGLLLGFLVVGGILLLTDKTTLKPNENHIVRLFDSGKQLIYPTKAETVGELLGKLNLNLIPEDVVEPALDTPIVEDNFRVNIYRANPVTIIDGTSRVVTVSAQKSARVLAQNAGLTIYPEDTVTFGIGSVTEDIIGQKVVIDRATPVNLILYGLNLTIRTHTKTVKDLLIEKQIKLAEGDTLSPDLSTAISPNMQVTVLRKGTQISTATEIIPVTTQYIDDSSLSFGTTVVRQAGSSGSKVVTYQVLTENGVQTNKTVIQEVIVKDVVPRIVVRGSAVNVPSDKTTIMAAVGIDISDYQYVYYIINHENALWCPTRWQGQNYCPSTFVQTYSDTASVGYGLCQSTPAGKMASAGSDWKINPVTQLRWCDGYAQARYGGWEAAYNHWINSRNW